ncbi:MAG: hypothetical protein RMM98_03445 [Acidobacteriota bacterium]|nr:hypothetical protein [Blastocatellia bacterium]MDW8238646.1 hypothetical protein [Acidobacteriota bacterium]
MRMKCNVKKPETVNSITKFVVMILAVTMTGFGQSKSVNKPVGEIVTREGQVKIDGTSAQRGATVFNGSEIEVVDGSAFLNLLAGSGVLSLTAGSRVKVSRDEQRVIAELMAGTITVRSALASTVVAPDRVITSEPDNLYTVSVQKSGTTVSSLSKSLMVRTADGAVQTVAAEAADTLAKAIARIEPRNDQPAQATERTRTAWVSARCMLTGLTLMVSGDVSCRGVLIAGAEVRLNVQLRDGTIITQTTTTDSVGAYKFTLTIPPQPPGFRGAAHVVAITNIPGCGDAGNRCYF